MSTTPKDGGPAFPLGDFQWNPENAHNNGMTLRDWFAGQALAGMSCSPSVRWNITASECYGIADAMLAARERKAGK